MNPDYPDREYAAGLEGWVSVRAHTAVDGAIDDVFVRDSSGVEPFERAVLSAVRRWRYAPFAPDGVPTERCGLDLWISLQVGAARSPRPSFLGRFEQLRELARAGDPRGARAALSKLAPESLAEVALAFVAQAMVAHAEGDPFGERVAISRALPGDLPSRLERGVATSLRRAACSAALVDRQYGTALELWKAIAQSGDAVDDSDREAASQLAAIERSPGLLATPARVQRYGVSDHARSHWRTPLLRHGFHFDDVRGALDRFEVCCEKGSLRDRVEPGRAWTTQPDWGACDLVVFGAEGATFTLVEPPQGPPDPGPAP